VLASLGITAIVFSYLFTHITLAEVLDLIQKADRGAIGLFIALSLSASFVRTWRYLVVLKVGGYSPPAGSLFLVVLVRNFFSDFLPARLGSLIYIFLVKTRLGVAIAPAAASFSLAFLFDILALAPILVVALWLAGASETIATPWALGGAALLGAGSLFSITLMPRIVGITIDLLSRCLPAAHPLQRSARRILLSIQDELTKCNSSRIFSQLLGLSLAVRALKYASLYVFLFALLHPLGYEWADLSVPKVVLGVCAAELSASLPVSGIAGFGVYEGTWAIAFELLGFPASIAKVTGVSHHLFTQIYGCIIGCGALLLLMLPYFRIENEGQDGAGSQESPAIPNLGS
jgi:uncharacterized membrane protein YbhN (UPF0104 family)